jgi:hypothetical protein
MFYKTAWTCPILASGTSGVISAVSSPTIQNSSEYSVIAALFSEVKLIRATVEICSIQNTPNSSVGHGRVYLGCDWLFSNSTYTLPTGYSDVQNTTALKKLHTYGTNVVGWKYPVPTGLTFSAIDKDSPATQTPWAGSPGCAIFFATGLTVSTNYLTFDFSDVVYHLRGRR